MPDFTGGADVWRDIPNGVVEQDQNQTDADAWASQQRAQVAQQWADSQRQQLTQQHPQYAAPSSDSLTNPLGTAGSTPDLAAGVPATASPLSSSDGQQPDLTQPSAGPSAANTPPRSPLNDISQLGQQGISYDDALAACGPAAAVRLLSIYGQDIPLKAALDAAKQVGWTNAGGMNGIGNEKRLLDQLGVPATVDTAPSLSKIISDAQSGNPVTVSTPNHYFTISGYNADTGLFHVGQSGTVFRGGSADMTWDQIKRLGGGVNGALFVDSPASSNPGTAALETGQTQKYVNPQAPSAVDLGGTTQQSFPPGPVQQQAAGPQMPDIGGALQGAVQNVSQTVQQAPQSFMDAVNAARQAVGGAMSQGDATLDQLPGVAAAGAPGSAFDPIGTTTSALQQGASGLRQNIQNDPSAIAQLVRSQVGQPLPDVTDPAQALGVVAGISGGGDVKAVGDAGAALSAGARTVLADNSGNIGKAITDLEGRIAGLGAAADHPAAQRLTGALDELKGLLVGKDANPFALHAEPGPNRAPLQPDDVASHIEDLQAQYDANDARISELENQTEGMGSKPRSATNIVRPNWAVGWTDSEILKFARDNHLNPYDPTWGTYSGDAAKETGYKGTGKPNLDPKAAAQELTRLRGTQEQILQAVQPLASATPETQFYRSQYVAPGSDLPFDTGAPNATQAAPEANGPVPADTTGGSPNTGEAQAGANPPSEAAAPSSGEPQQLGQQFPGVTGPTFPSGRPIIGRGGVPGANVGRAVNNRPGTTDAELPQSLVDTMRMVGASDAEIASKLRSGGASEEEVSAILGGTPAAVPPTGIRPANPMQNVTPQGTLAPGVNNIPGRAGGAVPPSGGKPPRTIPPGGAPPPPPPIPAGSLPKGVSQDMVNIAHQRIDRAIDLGQFPVQNQAAHDQLDQLLQSGNPQQAERFLATDVEGYSPSALDNLRSWRTGALAGGPGTMRQVLLGPIVQTAMRAPVAAVKMVVTGHAGDIPTGLQGGLSGLAEGSQEALQTLRYGTNWRRALTGSAGGGYGFKPGLDVLGANPLTRGIGTAMTGLVRTHGAMSDISAGIGRGAASALGATPEAAAEAGQQWALRSGNYGTVGQKVADALEGLRKGNPGLNIAGQILVPFYRVGYNVVTQGIERSPVGALGTAADVVRMAAGKGPYATGRAGNGIVTPLGQRLANNMFGVGLAGLGLSEAAQGNVTGERPAGGAPPWSVRVAGNWVPIRVLGPAGEAIAQSAALYEAARDGKGDVARTAGLSAGAYVQHVEDESWVRNVAQIFGMIGDVANAGNPNANVARTAQSDLAYQAKTIAGSNLRSVIPQSALVSQTANATGLPNPVTGAVNVVGLGTSAKPRMPSDVSNMLISQGLNYAPPPNSSTVSVGKLKVPVNQSEQDQIQQITAQNVAADIRSMAKDPSWAKASADNKQAVIDRTVARQHATAERQVLGGLPDAEIRRRLP